MSAGPSRLSRRPSGSRSRSRTAARHGLSEQEVATVVLATANGLILQWSIDPQAVPLDLLDRAVRLLLDAPAEARGATPPGQAS